MSEYRTDYIQTTLVNNTFIKPGNIIAKHTSWDFRIITPLDKISYEKLEYIRLQPTYWPTKLNKNLS